MNTTPLNERSDLCVGFKISLLYEMGKNIHFNWKAI